MKPYFSEPSGMLPPRESLFAVVAELSCVCLTTKLGVEGVGNWELVEAVRENVGKSCRSSLSNKLRCMEGEVDVYIIPTSKAVLRKKEERVKVLRHGY